MASDIEKQKSLLIDLLSQLPHRKSWSNLVHLLDSWPENAEREWAWDTALEKLDTLPPHSFLFQLKFQQQRLPLDVRHMGRKDCRPMVANLTRS